MGTSGAKQLYKTSNGGIIMRVNTPMECVVVGGKSKLTRPAIAVTELLYRINEVALLKKVAFLVKTRR